MKKYNNDNKTYLYQIAVFPTPQYQKMYQKHKDALEKLWRIIFGRQKVEIIQLEMAARYVRFVVKLPWDYHRKRFINTLIKTAHEYALKMCPEALCAKNKTCWEQKHWFKSDPSETNCYVQEISDFIQNKLHRNSNGTSPVRESAASELNTEVPDMRLSDFTNISFTINSTIFNVQRS